MRRSCCPGSRVSRFSRQTRIAKKQAYYEMLSRRVGRLVWLRLLVSFSRIIRSGLVPMVQTVKKTGVETTFRFRGESSVKVKSCSESRCFMEKGICWATDIRLACSLSLQALTRMKLGLLVCRIDNVKDYSVTKRFRFAVVDLDKSKSYPSNFVCMLPTQISGKTRLESIFMRFFGDDSLEQARALLVEALEREEDIDVKAEIEKRLKILEYERVIQIKCSGCGKLFQPRRVRKYQQNFCEECMKKRFGSRQ